MYWNFHALRLPKVNDHHISTMESTQKFGLGINSFFGSQVLSSLKLRRNFRPRLAPVPVSFNHGKTWDNIRSTKDTWLSRRNWGAPKMDSFPVSPSDFHWNWMTRTIQKFGFFQRGTKGSRLHAHTPPFIVRTWPRAWPSARTAHEDMTGLFALLPALPWQKRTPRKIGDTMVTLVEDVGKIGGLCQLSHCTLPLPTVDKHENKQTSPPK